MSKPRPRWVRLGVPLLVSVFALVLALLAGDLSSFRGIAGRVKWDVLPLVALVVVAIIAAFAWRWYTLLREELGLGRAALVTGIGLAANQLLPLRGGDALRVALTARGRDSPSLHAAVSALALEKVFDLIAVAAFGVASAFVFLGKAEGSVGRQAVVVAGAILLAAVAILASARYGWLNRSVRKVARWVGLSPRIYRHVYAPLHHLRLSASPARLALLLAETVIIWLALYVAGYLLIAYMISVPLALEDALVLLFAAAIGLAVPAAPSGIGTFHAAIVSAFVVLGRGPADGLLLAVAIHLVFFFGLCLAGALAIPFLALHRTRVIESASR